MPIFQDDNGELVAFQKVVPGPELYEHEIEALVWGDFEAFTGEALFPIARQAHIPGGGVPDILALDSKGHVVVIEVKRDVDRSQLAQCLEYAGWARMTYLEELASLYNAGPGHDGTAAFFTDWPEFTETATPVTIVSPPRLMLVARDFLGRTRAALDFLRDSSLPVTVIPVSIYEGQGGHRIINVDHDHDVDSKTSGLAGAGSAGQSNPYTVNGSSISVSDLIDAGLIEPDEAVEFVRPLVGDHYSATILSDGQIRLEDGSVCRTPSRAAMQAASVPSYDGWHAWRVKRLGGTKLHELRQQYLAKHAETLSAD